MNGVLGFDSWKGLGIFLFTTVSRTALGPMQPPIQWVPGALSLGVKQPGGGADHSPPSNAEVKECVQLYIHSPSMPSWHGAQLKNSIEKTLHLPLPFYQTPKMKDLPLLLACYYEVISAIYTRENFLQCRFLFHYC
jgi:hypothetical protein